MKDFDDLDMERVLDVRAPYNERRAAFLRLMEQAWSLGWEACAEEHRIALAMLQRPSSAPDA